MGTPNDLLLAYYGDDFTGSTDALEFLSRAGAKTVLFIQPPTPAQLARYQGLRAIGVAGMTRAMAPAGMEQALRPAFAALRTLGAPHIHYKVCSTFDSSPTTGSIGRAIDTGAEIFSAAFIPLLVAAPLLGRHCVFGNLFARMGTGGNGSIYRLDRHPSMSRHPVTPADESDLRLHLAHQTAKQVGLMDILQIALPEAEAREVLDTIIRNGSSVVLFDALYPGQMEGIGKLINTYASTENPLFSVGSSGIEMALGAHWKKQGLLPPEQAWGAPGAAAPLLVASGSCSPVNAAQIAWALSKGFAEISLDTEAIARNMDDQAIFQDYIAKAVFLLGQGNSVVLHTGGNEKTGLSNNLRTNGEIDTGRLYGTALGKIIRAVTGQVRLKRLAVAGGDTSSFAARAMGIEAVEMIAPLSPGAPLCRALAPGSPLDGLEINFKGGQVGREDYFEMVLKGKYTA